MYRGTSFVAAPSGVLRENSDFVLYQRTARESDRRECIRNLCLGPIKSANWHNRELGYTLCTKCLLVVKPKLRIKCKKCMGEAVMVSHDPLTLDDLANLQVICQDPQCRPPHAAECFSKCPQCSSETPLFGEDSVFNSPLFGDVGSPQVICEYCDRLSSETGRVGQIMIWFPCSHCICVDCLQAFIKRLLTGEDVLPGYIKSPDLPCPMLCHSQRYNDQTIAAAAGVYLFEQVRNWRENSTTSTTLSQSTAAASPSAPPTQQQPTAVLSSSSNNQNNLQGTPSHVSVSLTTPTASSSPLLMSRHPNTSSF
ncbi:hypothetical protein Pelo_2124 [Pelomyxa schiedti]|nr:hypothetical protein Pelo_2124 [Pelomyxa schiedti]